MNTSLTTVGTILRGKWPSNSDQRAVVWGISPNNPKRVLLWLKSGRYSWNTVESLDGNYEPAPADEPRWPGPTHEPPPDPRDRKPDATPLEVAATSAPAPVTPANDEPEPPTDEPPPAKASVTITLIGETASQLISLVDYLKNSLRGTGARITPTTLIEDLVEREYANTVKDLVKRELVAAGKAVA